MPIIETVSPDAPLDQGDILKDVVLYATDSGGDRHQKVQCCGCLIISRRCCAANKSEIVVARVDTNRELRPGEVKTFDEVHDFLKSLRGGTDSPDCFYLGQIPSLAPGRVYAKFDSLHTICLPQSPEKLNALRAKRVAKLAGDFYRDLHIRIFSAFAPLGFDDHGWLSDEDLKWLVSCGEFKLAEDKAAYDRAITETGSVKEQQTQARARTEKLLRPYQDELSRRAQKQAADTPQRP
jgi:hypothetical protein